MFIGYPLKMDNLNASREYVMGIIYENTFNPKGSSVIGNTAPPSNELNVPL